MNLLASFSTGTSSESMALNHVGQSTSGNPVLRASQVWRLEMERQQNETWFQPALPMGLSLASTAPHSSAVTVDAVPLAVARHKLEQPLGSRLAVCTNAASIAPFQHEPLVPGAVRVSSCQDGSSAVISTEQVTKNSFRSQISQLPSNEAAPAPLGNSVNGSALGQNVTPALTGTQETTGVHPQFGSPPGYLTSAVSLGEAEPSLWIQELGARAPCSLDRIASQSPYAQMQQLTGAAALGFSSTHPIANGSTTSTAIPLEEAGDFSVLKPKVSDCGDSPLPMRVHCGWQEGLLTVWIGHDRGYVGSAAMLVRAIEQWLATQRWTPASYIINGTPLHNDTSERISIAYPLAHADSDAGFDELIDHPLDATPYTVVRRAINLRENT